MGEKSATRAPGAALAAVLRNRQGATGPADLEARLHDLRPLEPSAEYVAHANQAMGRTPDYSSMVQDMGSTWGAQAPDSRAAQFRRDARAVEYSGAGAPGMVYANRDGAPVLMSLASARQQGLQIISADVARQLGQQAEAREAFAGAQASGSSGIAPQLAGAKATASPDPRMLAALLRAGR